MSGAAGISLAFMGVLGLIGFFLFFYIIARLGCAAYFKSRQQFKDQ